MDSIKDRSVHLFLVISIVLLSNTSFAQLLINEILASNSSVVEDPDFGDNSDWFELYNSGSEQIDISGYYFSDNDNDSQKWQLNQSVILAPGEYYIVWADGNDTSNHANFKLSASGEFLSVYNSDNELIDSVTFGVQQTDISYGRSAAAIEQWGFIVPPTPGAANATAFSDILYSVPHFSVRGGIFNSAVNIALSNYNGNDIRYTVDGSEPTENSAIYSGTISMSSTGVVRARNFRQGCIPGSVVTHTYFINEHFEQTGLPVVSIATDPDNFWDREVGIYVQDFKPDWEVPVNVELFENDGSDRAAFNETAGTKVNGLYSWQLPQKMLGVYFRKQYGSNKLEYPLFLDSERSAYKSFALRASGNDWSYTLFKDVVGQHVASDASTLDIMRFRPCVVYVNGQYMGIHNIREKVDDNYVEQNHNMDGGTFDMVENENYAEAGNLDEYNRFIQLTQADLSVQANFDLVAAEMDIDNFTDFIITEIMVRNTSINHNVMAWKPKSGGEWKWILMDLDRGFLSPTDTRTGSFVSQSVYPLSEMLRNASYKEYFVSRFVDQIFTYYNEDYFNKVIDEHQALIEQEIPYHVERWLGTTSSYGNAMPSVDHWYNSICSMRSFMGIRREVILEDLLNYGVDAYINMSIGNAPVDGGRIDFNNLKMPFAQQNGQYPVGREITLQANAKPGFQFEGWIRSSNETLIARNSEWKYYDEGNLSSSLWNTTEYDDAGWQSGSGILGYGDSQATTLSYGADAGNKHMTYYFRKTIQLTEEDFDRISSLVINLLRDDGAVVYINGQEVARSNMGCSEIDAHSAALTGVSGAEEDMYFTINLSQIPLRVGENILAVEVHQVGSTSSDVSFDLELQANVIGGELISMSPEITFVPSEDVSIIAQYERSTQCVIPANIDDVMVLYRDCSPYVTGGDVHIATGASLIVESGVEIQMPEGACITVEGNIIATGMPHEPIVFTSSGSEDWGILYFKNTSDTTRMANVVIEHASHGDNRITKTAAISAFNAQLILDNMEIVDVSGNPISARYSYVKLTNSVLQSDITGDLINVKYGYGFIDNCTFIGNNMPDTDAIDYDDVVNGIIRNAYIYNFYGYNSDAIDIGEQAENIQIENVYVSNVTDKGVSVGQQSSASIRNSVFTNCNLGMGLKDSCRTTVDNCTFYNTVIPVACYEKNAGSAGGNAIVRNSILSNSSEQSYLVDSMSSLRFEYSISDNDSLPAGNGNDWINPMFSSPVFGDFRYQSQSPAIYFNADSGVVGANSQFSMYDPKVMISQFYIDPQDTRMPEFIALYNPKMIPVDVSGYRITRGVTAAIPEGIIIPANDIIYLTDSAHSFYWNNTEKTIIQWISGKLSDNGESIELQDNYGIVIDYLRYDNDIWPTDGFDGFFSFELDYLNLDNHFSEYWSATMLDTSGFANSPDSPIETSVDEIEALTTVFPNPCSERLFIQSTQYANESFQVFNNLGARLYSGKLDASGNATIDMSQFGSGLLLLKVKDYSTIVVVFSMME